MNERIYKYHAYDDNDELMFAPILKMTLRHTSPFYFNDPYDCYIASSLNNEKQSVWKHTMENVYICSFAQTNRDLLMWSHYSSNHRGFVIEYNLEDIKSCIANQIPYNQRGLFSEINYSDDIKLRHFLGGNDEKEILDAIFHKALCWSYEHEVRSVIFDTPSKQYIDIKLDKNCIKGIYLGSQFFKQRENNIPEFLNEWHNAGKLFYMQLCPDKYKLEEKKDIREEWFKKES